MAHSIYVIGSSNTDMVVQCSRLPAPGETVLGGKFVSVQGGKGANQAVAAARLGGQVTFFCRVGDDDFGNRSLEAYRQEGINSEFIVQDSSEQSGVALIVVDEKGENYIAVAPGANAKMVENDVQPLQDIINKGDIILLQLEIPLDVVQHAAKIGRQKKAIVVLDPAPAPNQPLPQTLLQNVDYILPNEHEASALLQMQGSPETLSQKLLDQGVRNVIITCGSEGCVYRNKKILRTIPVFSFDVVDTTAAGDCFAGALAVALAEGSKIPSDLTWVQLAAAMSVTRMGAQPSLPTRNEVDTYTPF